MADLDNLAAEFQKDLDKAKKDDRMKREIAFARKSFEAFSEVLGLPKKRIRYLVNDSQDDLAYDLKCAHPGVQHITTTASVLSDWKLLVQDVRTWPHNIWGKFLGAMELAAEEYGVTGYATLIFRVKQTPWVMTTEEKPPPQLTPGLVASSRAGLRDIRIMPLDQYLKTMEK